MTGDAHYRGVGCGMARGTGDARGVGVLEGVRTVSSGLTLRCHSATYEVTSAVFGSDSGSSLTTIASVEGAALFLDLLLDSFSFSRKLSARAIYEDVGGAFSTSSVWADLPDPPYDNLAYIPTETSAPEGTDPYDMTMEAASGGVYTHPQDPADDETIYGWSLFRRDADGAVDEYRLLCTIWLDTPVVLEATAGGTEAYGWTVGFDLEIAGASGAALCGQGTKFAMGLVIGGSSPGIVFGRQVDDAGFSAYAESDTPWVHPGWSSVGDVLIEPACDEATISGTTATRSYDSYDASSSTAHTVRGVHMYTSPGGSICQGDFDEGDMDVGIGDEVTVTFELSCQAVEE